MIEEIDATVLARARSDELAGAVLLDVREAWEFKTARIESSVNIPMSTLPARLPEVRDLLADGAPLVLICHHGGRSLQCAHFLARQGVGRPINLRGGIDAWSRDVDSGVPRY
ncbi:MAG: sulfurtransferase [Burkholderiales bacterium]|nr:sulfurtransferase [Burkholderiales bacterium]